MSESATRGSNTENGALGATESVQLSKAEAAMARRRRRTVVTLFILLVIMIGVSAFLLVKYRQEATRNPVTRQQQLTQELGQAVELPPEQPVISTVLDRSKLSNQVLASRARNGDQLFIFPKSKRLILYRPSTHKVVDMLNIQT